LLAGLICQNGYKNYIDDNSLYIGYSRLSNNNVIIFVLSNLTATKTQAYDSHPLCKEAPLKCEKQGGGI